MLSGLKKEGHSTTAQNGMEWHSVAVQVLFSVQAEDHAHLQAHALGVSIATHRLKDKQVPK